MMTTMMIMMTVGGHDEAADTRRRSFTPPAVIDALRWSVIVRGPHANSAPSVLGVPNLRTLTSREYGRKSA